MFISHLVSTPPSGFDFLTSSHFFTKSSKEGPVLTVPLKIVGCGNEAPNHLWKNQRKAKDLSGTWIWKHSARGPRWGDPAPREIRSVWCIIPSFLCPFFRWAVTLSWLDGLTWISWNRWRRRWKAPAAMTRTRKKKWAAKLMAEVSLTPALRVPDGSQHVHGETEGRQKVVVGVTEGTILLS